jgi:hypothetical protein
MPLAQPRFRRSTVGRSASKWSSNVAMRQAAAVVVVVVVVAVVAAAVARARALQLYVSPRMVFG